MPNRRKKIDFSAIQMQNLGQAELGPIPLADLTQVREAMIDNAPIGFFLADTKGQCIHANSAWKAQTGQDPKKAMGLGWLEVVHPGDHKMLIDMSDNFRNHDTEFNIEFRVLREDGKIGWIQGFASKLFDSEGTWLGTMGYSIDITKRKENQIQLERDRSQAFFAAKTTELNEIAGSIAHEINNPLAVVSGKAYMIERLITNKKFDEQKILEAAVKIQATAERISSIIKNLRALTRKGEGDPFIESNLQQIVKDVLEFCQRTFKRNNIEFSYDIPSDISLQCRAVQIAQSIQNLLNNSSDAVANATDRWVKLEGRADQDWVELRITDSGPGIPPEIRSRIMEPFFSTKPADKGTGLGLPISENIIQNHGGTLKLDENSAQTCFVIRLPRKHSSPIAA